MPREHGSWAILLVPLAVGVAAAGALPPALFFFGLANLALFLARQPLGLLLRPGHNLTQYHLAWATVFLLLGTAFALPLLLLYRLWGLVPLGVTLVAAWGLHGYLQRRGWERRAGVQLLGIAALTATAPGAYYCARGAWEPVAFSLWGLSFLYFAGSVTFVPMMIRLRALTLKSSSRAWAQRWATGRATVLSQALALLLALAASILGLAPGPAALAFLPQTSKVILYTFLLPPVVTIKSLGWQEVAHALLFGVLLVLAYRLG